MCVSDLHGCYCIEKCGDTPPTFRGHAPTELELNSVLRRSTFFFLIFVHVARLLRNAFVSIAFILEQSFPVASIFNYCFYIRAVIPCCFNV